MSLKDLVKESGGVAESHHYRHYPKHDMEDQLWDWFHELEERFPEEVECDFIEVSPEISSHNALAYHKKDGSQFIRIKESLVEHADDWSIKRTLLHEMVHMYCYQKGHHDVSDSSHLFAWLCGAVGCEINQVSALEGSWEDLAAGFMDIEPEDET